MPENDEGQKESHNECKHQEEWQGDCPKDCQIEYLYVRKNARRVSEDMPDRMHFRVSKCMSDRMLKRMSEHTPEYARIDAR